MMDIIRRKWIFLTFSGLLVAASVWTLTVNGFKLGIDFTGGSLWQIKVAGTTSSDLQKFFSEDLKTEVSSVSYDDKSGIYALTFRQIAETERQADLAKIKAKFGEAKVADASFQAISPSVSDEIKNKAMMAIVFVVLGISLYIAFVFRKVSRPVNSWKYGIVTLITLIHDVVIPAGAFSFLSKYMGVAADTNFIVALLVVMGFSVHDTIVVFDRIRENIMRHHSKDFADTVNSSINETMRRSVNTSLTLVLVLLAIFFLGPASLKYFVLTMLIGTTAGTYSSIFVASPLLVVWHNLSRKAF